MECSVAHTGNGEPAPVLIYDAHCRLCVAAKEGMARRATNTLVRWVPYQSEEAACRLGDDYRPGQPEVAFFIGPDGQIKRGLEAFLPLLSSLRGGRFLQTILRVPFLKSVAYALYRCVARYRYRLFGVVEGKRI